MHSHAVSIKICQATIAACAFSVSKINMTAGVPWRSVAAAGRDRVDGCRSDELAQLFNTAA